MIHKCDLSAAWARHLLLSHDHFDNADRVKVLGVGTRLDAAGLSAARLATALQAMLERACRADRCRRMAACFDQGEGFAQDCSALPDP